MTEATISNWLSSIGTLAGGVAAVFAVWWARREVVRWRKQREEEKRVEVAAQCYCILTQAMVDVQAWMGAVTSMASCPGTTIELINKAYSHGEASAKETMGAVFEALPLTEIYIPESAGEIMRDAISLYEVIGKEKVALANVAPGATDAFRGKAAAFGEFAVAAEKIQKRARERLIPLARFQASRAAPGKTVV